MVDDCRFQAILGHPKMGTRQFVTVLLLYVRMCIPQCAVVVR